MATEETKVVGSFPPPPAYYKLFAPKPAGTAKLVRLAACTSPHLKFSKDPEQLRDRSLLDPRCVDKRH